MKRFWIILLSFGLIMVFGSTGFAAEAKFSGEFFLKGWYNKNHSLIDKDVAPFTATGATTKDERDNRGSTAFYTQRLRMGMNFQITKGLLFGTRFDALERRWMAARKPAPTGGKSPSITTTDSEAENIAFEAAFVRFLTPLGMFTVGGAYSSGPFGTPYSDAVGFTGNVISWGTAFGRWTVGAGMKKSQDGPWTRGSYPTPPYNDDGSLAIGNGTDTDSETYTLSATYRWSTGAFGTALTDIRSRTMNVTYTLLPPFDSITVYGRKTDLPAITLWAKNRFGKLYAEWEFGMVHFGHYVQYNSPKDPRLQDIIPYYAFSNYLNFNYDLSPFKIGFTFITSMGDDPETVDKREGGFRGIFDLDRSFNPCHILWNEDYMQWMSPSGSGGTQYGQIKGNAGSNGVGTQVQNVWFYQLYGDYDITPKLNLSASFTYAYCDKKPTDTGQPVGKYHPLTGQGPAKEFLSDKYGSELDFTLKYKIYDNLEYMIAAGYLWTGDYFKGTDPNAKLTDNYLITHKLTLNF